MAKQSKRIGLVFGVLALAVLVGLGLVVADVLDADDEVAAAQIETSWFFKSSYEPMMAWSRSPGAMPLPPRALDDLAEHDKDLREAIITIGQVAPFQLEEATMTEVKKTLVSLISAREVAKMRVRQLEQEALDGRHPGLRPDQIASFKAWAAEVDEIISESLAAAQPQ